MDVYAADLDQLFFRKAIPRNQGQFSLNPDTLRILLSIDEHKSMAEILGETGLAPTSLRDNLDRLMRAGLISPVRNGTVLDRKTFYEPLEKHLKEAVGPMSGILMDGVLDDLGLDPDAIPAARAAELILGLSAEIRDSELRQRFQKAMVRHIPKSAYHR